MAMDHFLEEVVVKKERTMNEVLYVLSMVVVIVSGLMGLISLQMLMVSFSVGGLMLTVVNIGVAVLLFLFRSRLRTEYEYTFTNGSMDFAMVFNNQKRKSLGSLNVRNVDVFGPVNGSVFNRYISMPNIKKMNWFLNRGAELYFFFFQKDGNKRIIICEPSKEMVDYIKQYLPRGAYQE